MTITVFQPAAIPLNERNRRNAVLRSKILGMTKSDDLLLICQEVKLEFRADAAAVVVIIDEWQHVIACNGMHIGSTRRSSCLSSFVLLSPDGIFTTLNVRNDPELANSSFVQEGLLAFYAGAAIKDKDGFAVGILCITSKTSRAVFSDPEKSLLIERASSISSYLD